MRHSKNKTYGIADDKIAHLAELILVNEPALTKLQALSKAVSQLKKVELKKRFDSPFAYQTKRIKRKAWLKVEEYYKTAKPQQKTSEFFLPNLIIYNGGAVNPR